MVAAGNTRVTSFVAAGDKTKSGHADGDQKKAKFRAPEGLCYASGVLWVADTANHVLRAAAPATSSRPHAQSAWSQMEFDTRSKRADVAAGNYVRVEVISKRSHRNNSHIENRNRKCNPHTG